jgi:histidinol-phosphate phosphatase family protein
VFLDRDGTIIDEKGYLADPDAVSLVDGAAAAIARLREAGIAVVVVTNQSGIARGWITPAAYTAVENRVAALLAAAGAGLDATYVCPHHPDVTGPCDCRKPASGLFARAARDLDLDLGRSVLVGDRWRDIAPAVTLKARGILVPSAVTPDEDSQEAQRHAVVAPTLTAAVDLILGDSKLTP